MRAKLSRDGLLAAEPRITALLIAHLILGRRGRFFLYLLTYFLFVFVLDQGCDSFWQDLISLTPRLGPWGRRSQVFLFFRGLQGGTGTRRCLRADCRFRRQC